MAAELREALPTNQFLRATFQPLEKQTVFINVENLLIRLKIKLKKFGTLKNTAYLCRQIFININVP